MESGEDRPMRIVSITPELEVLCRNGAGTESTGKLFSGYTERRVDWPARLLGSMARGAWIPASAARPLLRACRDAICEALLARDPDALDVSLLSWGAQLREMLWESRSWPWIRAAGDTEGTPSLDAAAEDGSGPLVSVVLPTYNGVRFLADSIRSCLDQTYRNVELIVV